eukprot:2218395-Alexandrium_andersonii.AAC.1
MCQVRPGMRRAALHARGLKYTAQHASCAATTRSACNECAACIMQTQTARATRIAQPACCKNTVALPRQRAHDANNIMHNQHSMCRCNARGEAIATAG